MVQQRGRVGDKLGDVRAGQELLEVADLDGEGAVDVVGEKVGRRADDLDDVGA